MKTVIISTKEIRNDLEGFFKTLKSGQPVQVMYRSKPLVRVVAEAEVDPYLADDAGTPQAARRSLRFVRALPARKPVFDSHKSFKQLYDESQTL